MLQTKRTTLLLDPGPSSTIPYLVELLEEQGVDVIDFVLLTHVHIDHSGGIGDLISLFPGAKVISHPRSFKHLIDPGKLWAGSLEVLGDLANRYGPIRPIPEKALLQTSPGIVPGLSVIDTPGHSSHHQSYLYTDRGTKLLFAGEAAGVYLGDNYIRPATPPRFFFDVAYESLQKLISLEPTIICYGHYGFTDDPTWLEKAALQMVLWRQVLDKAITEQPDINAEQALVLLEQHDPYLKRRHRFDDQVASRERCFLENSVRGFLQYLVDE